MNINSRIKLIRISKNLGQEYIAEKLGITQSTYAKIESVKIELKY